MGAGDQSVTYLLAAGTYWLLIVMWSFILAFYLHRLFTRRVTNRLVIILIVVLAIDALRTLVESLHFGAWYTSLAGFLPEAVGAFLTQPEMVLVPKLLNVFAAGLIIFILLMKWLPQEERELAEQRRREHGLEAEVAVRTQELRRAKEELEERLQHKRMLMNELDHRVKNNLASVVAMTRLTLDDTSDPADAREALIGRVHALARSHELLADLHWQAVPLRDLIMRAISPYQHPRSYDEPPAKDTAGVLTVDGPDVLLKADAVSPVGMVLHELAINAVKHGSLSTAAGQTRIDWTLDDEHAGLTLRWRESGVDAVARPESPGFGLQLIEGLVAQDLAGSLDMAFEPGGVAVTIHLPAEKLESVGSGAPAEETPGCGASDGGGYHSGSGRSS